MMKFDGAFAIDRLGRGGGFAVLWRHSGISVTG